jgi:ferredoxin
MNAPERVTMEIDQTLCIGAGRCEQLDPDAFTVGDDGVATVDPTATFTLERANELCTRCPSGAIGISP